MIKLMWSLHVHARLGVDISCPVVFHKLVLLGVRLDILTPLDFLIGLHLVKGDFFVNQVDGRLRSNFYKVRIHDCVDSNQLFLNLRYRKRRLKSS